MALNIVRHDITKIKADAIIAERERIKAEEEAKAREEAELAAIEEAHNEVLSKVPWMLERGGYIPHIDHAIPHDVPLENYLYYRKLLTKVVYGQY